MRWAGYGGSSWGGRGEMALRRAGRPGWGWHWGTGTIPAAVEQHGTDTGGCSAPGCCGAQPHIRLRHPPGDPGKRGRGEQKGLLFSRCFIMGLLVPKRCFELIR